MVGRLWRLPLTHVHLWAAELVWNISIVVLGPSIESPATIDYLVDRLSSAMGVLRLRE